MIEPEEEILEQCPNCGAIWGCEEFDFQSCDCCGYPDVNMDNDYFDYDN
jgi:hypothetical protein